ncbi:hypothetical protein KC887_00755 [Candidatus Kaiserbacteria bacterium]|nr:hypothetical protein [Candidatus Kaiserbacteria bacterium]
MKSKDRKIEDEAKQQCFASALEYVRSNYSEVRKYTNLARALAGQEKGEEFDQMHNLISSIRYGRSTPPDYIAQRLYELFPSDNLLDLLSFQFTITVDRAKADSTPIEEELPEILLNRIRELKSERAGLAAQVSALEQERNELVQEIENSLSEKNDPALKRILDMLRESNLIL